MQLIKLFIVATITLGFSGNISAADKAWQHNLGALNRLAVNMGVKEEYSLLPKGQLHFRMDMLPLAEIAKIWKNNGGGSHGGANSGSYLHLYNESLEPLTLSDKDDVVRLLEAGFVFLPGMVQEQETAYDHDQRHQKAHNGELIYWNAKLKKPEPVLHPDELRKLIQKHGCTVAQRMLLLKQQELKDLIEKNDCSNATQKKLEKLLEEKAHSLQQSSAKPPVPQNVAMKQLPPALPWRIPGIQYKDEAYAEKYRRHAKLLNYLKSNHIDPTNTVLLDKLLAGVEEASQDDLLRKFAKLGMHNPTQMPGTIAQDQLDKEIEEFNLDDFGDDEPGYLGEDATPAMPTFPAIPNFMDLQPDYLQKNNAETITLPKEQIFDF